MQANHTVAATIKVLLKFIVIHVHQIQVERG